MMLFCFCFFAHCQLIFHQHSLISNLAPAKRKTTYLHMELFCIKMHIEIFWLKIHMKMVALVSI